MANRRIQPTSAALVTPPGPIRTPEGGFLDTAPVTLETFLKIVASRLNGGISLGDGAQSSQAGNLDAQTIRWVFAGANTEYEIPHGLGRPPIGFLVIDPDRATSIYSSNRGGWGDSALFLKSSVANAEVVFLVF